MTFQIKYTKDYLRNETGRIIKIIDHHESIIQSLEEELEWIDKCREEINKANKLIRDLKCQKP